MSRAVLVLAGLSLLAAADPLDRYNAGVASLSTGKLEEAIEGFEAAAVSAEGPLRNAALFNLGLAHARRGDESRAAEPEEPESRDARVRRLTTAAESYRRALALFRRVPPPASDADAGADAAKIRLLAVLDEVQKLAEEAKREAEEKALSDPPRLLLATMTGERDRRRAAVRLSDLTRRQRRIPARRVRQAEFEARTLMEKLAAALAEPAQPAPGPSGAPAPAPAGIPPELANSAADPVRRAAAAMAEAEGRLDGRDGRGAADAQGTAIRELAAAARILPVALPELVGKLEGDQESLLSFTGGGASPLLAVEEGEIRGWLALLSGLPDPAPDPSGDVSIPAETMTRIRALAGEADAAAGRAESHLEAGRTEESRPDQEIVIEKLQAIRELLPKPPESPAEKIRRLLAEEEDVGEAVSALPGLSPEARAGEGEALGARQTENGRTAGSIAEELTASPGEREKAAAEKVRDAEAEIHASSEGLRRERWEPAGKSVERAVESLTEALEILSGEQEQQQDQQQDQGNEGERNQDEEQKEDSQDIRKLDSREARRRMEEMDRERREEEAKLFRGLGGPKVEKDW